MFASIAAARGGHEVLVFEKNEKLGKKLFITGKGRCNITNACDMDTLFSSIVSNSKFLYSSFYGYSNQDVIDFFEELGVRTKIERGERVFPASDHSSDVIRAMEKEMRRLGVKTELHAEVTAVRKEGLTISNCPEAGRCREMPASLLQEACPTSPPVQRETAIVLRRKTVTELRNACLPSCQWR